MTSALVFARQDYPLLNLFWTMLWLFVWILWIFLVFRIIADIFSSSDLSGWGKAGWAVLIILLPYLGAFIYLIARGTGMHTREAGRARQSQEAFRAYVQETASTASVSEEITKLAALRDQGVLTEDEFAAQKAKLLHV